MAGLVFAFQGDADPLFVENAQAMTGYAQGLITINIAEADNAWRERMRQDMAEQGQYHRVSYWCLQISLFWGGIWMLR